MNRLLGAGSAFPGMARLRDDDARLSLAASLAASTIVAIIGLIAVAPRQAAQATQAPPVNQQSLVYAGEPTQQSAPKAAQAGEDARRFTGRVGGDLTKSLQAAGVPEGQGREYVSVLGRAIELASGLSAEDRFDLVIERDQRGKLGRLLYAGLDRIARADVELLKWTDGKSIIWVNPDGVGGDSNNAMRMPVSGRVTSRFGNRFHPILGYERFHKGVDLGAAAGTPIFAAADGRVVSAGWRGGYGRQVAIVHTDGIQTSYGHMSRIAAYPGEMVRRGQLIGYVGSSGLSTGPHLHFEVVKNGRPVNPLSVKFGSGPDHLEGEKLHAFHDELRQLLLLPDGEG